IGCERGFAGSVQARSPGRFGWHAPPAGRDTERDGTRDIRRKGRRMRAYIIRRLLLLVPVWLFVSFITFLLIHLVPGDPARVQRGEDATPENVAALRQQLGLDRPLYEQFALWLNQAVHGNLGESIQLHQPVLQAILQRLPVTIELGVAA